MGFMSLFMNIGMFISPYASGLVKDAVGDYYWVLAVFTPLYLVERWRVAFLFATRPDQPARSQRPVDRHGDDRGATTGGERRRRELKATFSPGGGAASAIIAMLRSRHSSRGTASERDIRQANAVGYSLVGSDFHDESARRGSLRNGPVHEWFSSKIRYAQYSTVPTALIWSNRQSGTLPLFSAD